MIVKLVDKMGSDLSVVNAARVSFAKESEFVWKEKKDSSTMYEQTLSDKDKKLINYLAEHDHWSPFGHASLQFHIKAPIFVARQLVKHQVGLVWNEVSRRYVDDEPEFYEPDEWRGRPLNSKQGSSDEVIDINPSNGSGPMWVNDYQQVISSAKWTYEQLLRRGVCPEQARMVLPQSLMTEWYWSGTLIAFARVCNLRCKLDTQLETQLVAKEINSISKKEFPISWRALRS